MQDLNHKEFCFLTQLFALCVLLRVKVEPLSKFFAVIENLRHHEVKQTPELCDVILEWGTSQKQPSS